MRIRIETQSRKKAKLTRYMDVTDFQLLLITGLIVPFCLWFFLGVSFAYSWVPVAAFIFWLFRFKIDRPAGYWEHWLNFQLRGKAWTAYAKNTPQKIYRELRKKMR